MNKSCLNSVRNALLSSKPSKAIRLLLMVLFVSSFANAVTITSTQSGNWNATTTWVGGVVPSSGDAVVIAANHTVTVNGTFTCASLVIGTNNNIATLTFSGAIPQLTVTGSVVLGNATNSNRRGVLTFINGSKLVAGSITNGNNGANGTITMTAGGILEIGSFTASTGTWTPGTGTVVMTATNTIPNTIFTSFYNLTISAGTTTFGAVKSITNNFSIATSAIANLGTFSHTAGVLTLGGQGTIPGSWGSTSSTATNKDYTYFAAATGLVNNSCTAPSITSQPTALTICENTGGSFSVAATGAFTYQWQYSADNINWTNIDAALNPYVAGYTTATFTLSNTPAAWTNNYVRCAVWSSGGCRTNSSSVLLTVSPTLTAPTVGTITQPTCSTATGSVVLSGLPTGSWVLTRSPGSVTTTGTGTSTTISGLAAGTTYTYSVDTANNGTGLKGEYFNNMTLSGSPTLTRTEANVNFNWGAASPDASINNDGFSVRWSGLVQPIYSEIYTFSTSSDDGIRLWVNGVQIINNWTNHGVVTNTGTISLTAGVKYSIVLEFYENGGDAVSTLSWSSASQGLQIIPTTQLFPAGSCASPGSANIVINTQPATPAVPTGTATQSFCSGATVANLLVTGTNIQWYAAASGGSALATTTALVNGTHYYATQTTSGCESSSRFDVTVTVNTTPTITPNKVDETCPVSNNGTIAPTISGGLTNIRYIKLTQKYADWQQVAEIQAFQIFTGTNVALASNGATATSSSNYSNDAANYGPQKAIDGDYTNYSFWHSNSTSINEYILVDLQSGKNLDYLRIHNRVDCCQQRGQNMLLELFDASNNLVYSKTIDLWEGVNGAHYIDVNVLDVSWADSATSLNRTALDSGTYTLNYTDAVGCSASSPINIGSINPILSTPTVTPTLPTCSVGTGSITVNTPAPATGITYTVTGTSPVVAGITNATGLFSGLSAGTYDVTTTNPCGTSTAISVTLALVKKTWGGSSWLPAGNPTADENIEFTGNYNLASDVTACSCTVTSGTVTIPTGNNLILGGKLTVNTPGTLTFEDKASLVQINNVVNSGDIIYKRTTSSVLASDYTYWSSPVANQNLSISPSYASGMFFSYNDFAVPEDWKSETATSVMLTGKGYIIRGPQITGTPPPPGFYSATFKGVPNNGTKTIAIGSAGTSSLLGNPYPSAISADLFLAANSTLVEGTIYFWTHKTAIQLASNIASGKAGSGVLAYTSDDYASYNGTGGVAVIGGVIPNGKIAAGQAFFITSLGAGTVTFNNAMRLAGTTLSDVTGVNQQFFKTKNTNTKTANAIEKNRVWLNLANAEGAFKQTLVGYITDATNEYDRSFDGESFDGNEFVDFYSINQDKNLVIQGRALPFDENDEVPLGYRTAIEGAFTINIDQVDGALADQAVFVEDKLTNTVFNLKDGNYTFNTVAGTFNDRFVLRYTNKTLGAGEFHNEINQVVVSVKNKQVKINSFAETIDKVEVYDLSGRQIYKKDKVNDSELLITNFNSNHQALVVKTILQNGKMVMDKIIY